VKCEAEYDVVMGFHQAKSRPEYTYAENDLPVTAFPWLFRLWREDTLGLHFRAGALSILRSESVVRLHLQHHFRGNLKRVSFNAGPKAWSAASLPSEP
jgi:hypothetical protein